jgi:hypothetical protein
MGEVFSWENEAEYASVVRGAGSAGPRQKFKIAVYGHKYFYNHTKKPAKKQPGPGNRPGKLLPAPGPHPGASGANAAGYVEKKVLEFKEAVVSIAVGLAEPGLDLVVGFWPVTFASVRYRLKEVPNRLCRVP